MPQDNQAVEKSRINCHDRKRRTYEGTCSCTSCHKSPLCLLWTRMQPSGNHKWLLHTLSVSKHSLPSYQIQRSPSFLGQVLTFQPLLDHDGANCHHGQQDGGGEGAFRIIFFVGRLHKERQGLGASDDVAGDDGDGPKLSYGSLQALRGVDAGLRLILAPTEKD